ncbi:MAG: Peptidase [Verrucomicrobiales bacterium]|nr:Peptidase [Verrucomicrobiales bacterium]
MKYFWLFFSFVAFTVRAELFRLPTANRAIFDPDGGAERFFVGTTGKPWTSGTFGCVRSDGNQIHEGLDIKCLQRDKHGEPIDPVRATAAGTVAYVNNRPALSNYGRYIVIRHDIEGIEIYSIYAHLSEVLSSVRPGSKVNAGDQIAIMGRTSNTRERISKERAHVHFELNVVLNDRFAAWYAKAYPNQRNDHGDWNGHNLLGLDPRLVLLEQQKEGDKFSILNFLRTQTELFRVVVRDVRFPYLKRYTALIRRNPVAEQQGVAGYEIAFNYNGLPFQIVPRSARELENQQRVRLLSVNADEQARHPCRHLVARKGSGWELTRQGGDLIELLLY